MPLMSDDDFGRLYTEALARLGERGFHAEFDHQHRKSEKARISALGSCGRQQYLEIIGAPITDFDDGVSNWAQMLGSAGQAIATEVLREMGYTVFDVEATVGLFPQNTPCEIHPTTIRYCSACGKGVLGDTGLSSCHQQPIKDGKFAPCWVEPNGMVHTSDPDYMIPGHIDGKITGLDFGDKVYILDVKLRNTFGMYGTNTSYGMAPRGTKGGGLPAADQGVYLQLETYDNAEDTDGCMVLLAPFDMSASRIAAWTKKAHAQGAFVPPAYRVIMEKDLEAHALGEARGRAITAAVKLAKSGNPLRVQREREPTSHRLCDFCSWKTACIVQGPEYDIAMPPIPDEWKFPRAGAVTVVEKELAAVG